MKKIILLSLVFVLTINLSLFAKEYVFCSSKTSEVFHYLDCRYVSNFSQENADYYTSYEEAIQEGLRECRVCKPEPQEAQVPDEPGTPDWIDDPNRIWIEPSPTPAILFPINGVVLQSEYCSRRFDPRSDIGGTILKTDHKLIPYSEAKNNYSNCLSCAFSIDDKTDPNYMVLIADNDRTYFHIDEDCFRHKEVPVRMVNLRSGMIAGNDAFFHPAMGVLEWKITPFEIGDYTAVMNSDVGQMQLLSLTIKQAGVPPFEEFSGAWLSGNFNLYKYNEWVEQRELHQKKNDRSNFSTGKMEWVFQDGQWVPISNGHIPLSDIFTMQITENTTYERKTTEEEIKVAPYEWKTKYFQLTEITTTDYEGIEEWGYEKELASKLGYLSSPTFAKQNASILSSISQDMASYNEEDEILRSGEPEEYFSMIGVRPEPEKIEEPELEKFYKIVEKITNSEIDSDKDYKELVNIILMAYEEQKEAYEKYVEDIENWEREIEEAVERYSMENYHMIHEERDFLDEYDYNTIPMSVLTDEDVIWVFEDGRWTYRTVEEENN